jgi:hypothetical protein
LTSRLPALSSHEKLGTVLAAVVDVVVFPTYIVDKNEMPGLDLN